MHLCSVNVGKAQRLPGAKAKTGIVKTPVEGPVRLTEMGVEGDAVCDRRYHGGPDQAVYLYGTPDYAWWSQRLGQEVMPGTFGENLTVTDLESASTNIGDRFHVGDVILEVTAPRVPCGTLARRMNDPAFPRLFVHAERPGIYCRVIQEGWVQVGQPVTWEQREGPVVSALEVFRDFYAPDQPEAEIRRILAAPLAARVREYKENQLRQALMEARGDS